MGDGPAWTHAEDPMHRTGTQAALGGMGVSRTWVKAPFSAEKSPKWDPGAKPIVEGWEQEVRGRGETRQKGK